ncbi:hypothetical protein LAZ67_13001452 [Cordylochernes scorpioides]|uniref:Retrovirus-related Pol polyprotein from transposon TNT 1-94 n=1 Tax=Cordylochernes scorpioides TaxID=51811 RepID=A0ABY6L6D0_9ARAC|nr:hypothetical protein LAZ67_13001452 [Cordylochernes scorpioides]
MDLGDEVSSKTTASATDQDGWMDYTGNSGMQEKMLQTGILVEENSLIALRQWLGTNALTNDLDQENQSKRECPQIDAPTDTGCFKIEIQISGDSIEVTETWPPLCDKPSPYASEMSVIPHSLPQEPIRMGKDVRVKLEEDGWTPAAEECSTGYTQHEPTVFILHECQLNNVIFIEFSINSYDNNFLFRFSQIPPVHNSRFLSMAEEITSVVGCSGQNTQGSYFYNLLYLIFSGGDEATETLDRFQQRLRSSPARRTHFFLRGVRPVHLCGTHVHKAEAPRASLGRQQEATPKVPEKVMLDSREHQGVGGPSLPDKREAHVKGVHFRQSAGVLRESADPRRARRWCSRWVTELLGAILISRTLIEEFNQEGKTPRARQASNQRPLLFLEKNDEAFGIIVTTLSDEKAGMFLDETKAKKVWDELKKIYTGNLEDKIIDIGLELKNIKMKNNESINEYMARAKNIASQSSSLGHQISQRELAFHIVRGIHPRLEKIAVVLRTRRDLTLDEIRQSLREEENLMNSKMNGSHSDENEQAYRSKDRRNHYQQNRQKECFVCHKKGHLAKDCWFKNKRTQEQHGKRNANSNTNYNKQNFRNNANTVSSKPAEQTFNTSTDRVFENSSNNYSQIQTWCLDSGCTTHLSPHLDWMENVMPYESGINLAEEGKVTHATAKGDIKVSTCTENGIENVQIKGVLHDRMYVMETRSRDEYSEKTENVMTTKDDFSNDNISLWHRRLNHLNEAYMKEIIQRNVVLGFNVNFKNLPECEACIMGKLTRQPYHPVTTNCTTKPLELVHMDLCGPMPYQSLGGSKYFFVLVDDFSRRTFIYFLKNKDETLGKFEEFKARVENELNLKIKDVRTDNGTEFTNHRFKNFLIKNGIHHQLSTTYSPQSNGVAERVNRTLIETARTLLFDSGLPMAFWAEAVATASYVKNCTPHRSIKLDTPMEKWKGKKPSIRHFRIFGCLAFWPITQQHRSKFMPKSRKGIFVGYSLKRKAYRVYDIITKKIEEVRSVKFVENEKGIDYAKNLQEDTNYDHFSYKKEEEADIEIDHRTRPETSELNEETIPTLDEPNEERIVRSGRKKGDTQEVLEEKHRAKLREGEMKLLEQGVRRSQRIKERNNVNFILEPEERIPENYEEAINCENKYEWLEAMKEELYSINKHKVWTLVQREKNMKIINCKWIFSIKSTPSKEYEESFSPVIRKESLRAIVALAAQLNLVITSYDVKTAYLYGELKETIFMKQPEGFVEKGEEDKVCKLLKSIYGLPQSGHCWNKKINEILIQLGMERSQYDPCVYTFRKGKEYGILGLYVDDLIIAGTDKTFNEKLASEIGRFVALKEKGENEPFIGIEIRKTEYGFDLSQAHYIDKILKKFALQECNIVQTPGDRDQSFDECQDSKPVDRTLYQEMIGSLMHLATGTRPDISFNVSNLSRFCNDAREVHLTGVKRIYRYLKGTRDKMLRYKPSENSILVSTDASWCSTSDAKSYSGYTVKLGNNLISWRSKKQSLVALSTCEAEMISICEGMCEVKWIKVLLEELCKDANFPTTLKTDSQSAIKWIKSEKITSRTKHINRKLYFIKDAVEEGTIDLESVRIALILNCKTIRDIWIALHERYEGDKKKRIIEARNDVSRLTMKKEENWEEYLYRAEKLLEQARNLGADIEDQEFTTSVIRGLPQKYNLVALQLNCQMKVIDSGASCHMTSNRDLLKEEREVHKTIKLADDSEIISNAEGAIEIEGHNKLIRLNDVLYVEKLSGNLMSVNKLVDDNEKLLFDKDGEHIMEEDGEEILMAQRINDFYIIKTSAPEEIPSQA